MKQKWFDKKLYLEGLRTLRMPGLALLIAAVALTLFPILTSAVTRSIYTYMNLTPVLAVYIYLAPVLLVFTAFSFLFRRNASDLYHALPVTRKGLYLSLSASIVTWLWGTIILTRLLGYLCVLFMGQTFTPVYLALQTLSYCAAAFLITTCALIGVSATGTRFSAFIVSGVILFLPRCVSVLCGIVLSGSAPLLSPVSQGILFDFGLNIPVAWFLYGILGVGSYVAGYAMGAGWGLFTLQAHIYTFVLALIYLALGAVAFGKRASETAEKAASTTRMQHVYRCLISMPLFLLLATLMADRGGISFDREFVLLLIFAVLVYFLYELITTKRFKNLLPALYILPIPVILCFGLAFGTRAYGKAQMGILPAAEELASIKLSPVSQSNLTYGQLLQAELAFTEPELLKLSAEGLAYSYEGFNDVHYYSNQNQRLLILQRKTGGSLARKINFTNLNALRFDELLSKNGAYRAAAMALPKDAEIYQLSYSNPYDDGYAQDEQAALAGILSLYRQERSRLSYEDIAPYVSSYGMFSPQAMPATLESEERVYFYPGDAILSFGLKIEGMYKGMPFSENHVLTQKTPAASNAAMRFANEREQEALQKIKALLNSGDTIEWVNVRFQLCNVPLDNGVFNSEYLDLLGMSAEEIEEGASKEKYLDTLTIEEARRLLSTLLSAGYEQPDVTKPFVQFKMSLDYMAGEQYSSSQPTNFVYAALDESTLQALLAYFPSLAFAQESAS